MPERVLGRDLALAEGRVRELPVAGDVADGVDVRARSCACGASTGMRRGSAVTPAVSRPMSSTFATRPVATSTMSATSSLVSPRVSNSASDEIAVALLDPRGARAELDGDAAAAEGALERGDGVGVLVPDQVREHLDDRDGRAELRVDGGELDADHAAAEHGQAPRHGVQLERAGRVDAARVVDAGNRRGGRARARRDDGALELDVLAALDGQRVRPGEAAAALDDLDAVGLEQPGEALDDAVHDAAAVALHLLEVEIDVADAHAELCEVPLRVVVGVRGLHHGLRRDAARR